MKKYKDASNVLIRASKYYGGFLDGEEIKREKIAKFCISDRVRHQRLDDGRFLRSIYELHRIELESETRGVAHYRLKSEEIVDSPNAPGDEPPSNT